MSTKKLDTVLFRKAKTPVRFVETSTGTAGAAGIVSLARGTSPNPAKYSTLCLAIDKILVDKEVLALQMDGCVYVKIKNEGSEYVCLATADSIRWVGEDPSDIDAFFCLIPMLSYALSDNYTDDSKEELEASFMALRKMENAKKNLLILCDNFYYGFVHASNNIEVGTTANSITPEEINRGLSSGVFTNIPALADINDMKADGMAVTEEETEVVEQDYNIVYEGFSDEQKKKIPSKSVLDSYVMTSTAQSLARKIKYRLDKVKERLDSGSEGVEAIGNDYINVLMVGRPATGKSTLANAVAAMTGLPIYTVPFSKNTEEDTAEGKNKVVDGQIAFVETEFLKAYEHGGIIVCEEINLADPAVVMGCLGQSIEKPFILMKDGYKPVRRHPMCVIIGTMNTGTAGSRSLNQALSSRFKCTYTLDDPDKATFINILAAQGFKKSNCRYVYDAYNRINKYLKSPEVNMDQLCDNLTLRGCIGALECIEEGDDGKSALINTLVGKIAETDLEMAEQIKNNVIDALPNLKQ